MLDRLSLKVLYLNLHIIINTLYHYSIIEIVPVIDRVIATITVLISSRNCNHYITSYLHAKVFIIV